MTELLRSAEEEAKVRELLSGKTTSMPVSVNALQVLAKRYLLKSIDGAVLENPEEMFDRVAKRLAEVELSYNATESEAAQLRKEWYEIMFNMEFTPAGRTLANCGGPTKTVPNCIVLHIEDNMESIMGTLYQAALLQKDGSGLGFPLHLLRPAGSVTKRSFGSSSGPVSFLHVYNTAFGVIKQQNRNGANMAVMAVTHPDILEFIHCKDVEGAIRNFNVSVGLTTEFMKQVESNTSEPWMCEFNGVKMLPRRITRDGNYNILNIEPVNMTAREIFDEIVSAAWNMGEPGCVFLDTVNAVNPLPGLGRIEACNPCGEQFLHDGDVCNLGSINLEKFVTPEGKVDFERLRHVVRLSVRLLDNVIDVSEFSVEKVANVFRNNRRIGLGIMGFADMLYQMKIGYHTEEGRDIARAVMKCINETSHETSEQLATQKGTFPNYDKSIYAQRGQLRRNAALTNIAPTGTISMVFDVSGGVEPYFALAYFYKGILGGNVQLQYVNKHLRRALEEYGLNRPDIYDRIVHEGSVQGIEEIPDILKKTFVTSMDISAEAHILMQAAFQEHCDNAISKTINFANNASKQDVLRGYLLAWRMGCKGCTAYRDGSRQLQVLNLNKDEKPAEETVDETDSVTSEEELKPTTSTATTPELELQVVGGTPVKNAGGDDDGAAICITPPKKTKEAPVIDSYTSSVLKKSSAFRKVKTECPDCGAPTRISEGCYTCTSCGLSACGM